jgi:hypothetical protein
MKRTRGRPRCFGAWAATCVLMATLAASGRPASAEPLPKLSLGRVNVLAGSNTGYVPVRLHEPAVLDFSAFAASRDGFDRLFRERGPTPAIDIEGGSFAGFMLTDDTVRDSGPVVLAGTFRNCVKRCKPGEIVNFSYPISLGRKISLDPGNYRLFLITSSGDPARVTFRFDKGPAGRTKLRPETPTHADASAWLAPDDFERTIHSSTVPHQTFSDAFGLSLMVVDGPYTAEGMGTCMHNGTVSTGQLCGPNRFTSRINAGPVGGRQPTFVFFGADLGLPPEDWWLGGWYANPTPPDLLSVMTLTVDYDPTQSQE